MKLTHSLALVFFLSVCSLANAQSLWRGSQYGMKLEQIMDLFPSAKQPVHPDSLYNGATELVRISEFEIEGYVFSVSFFFKNEALDQVMLSASGIETAQDGQLAYALLLNSLTEKYGDQEQNNQPAKTKTSLSSSWALEKTEILLHYSEFPYSEPILNVIYRLRPSS